MSGGLGCSRTHKSVEYTVYGRSKTRHEDVSILPDPENPVVVLSISGKLVTVKIKGDLHYHQTAVIVLGLKTTEEYRCLVRGLHNTVKQVHIRLLNFPDTTYNEMCDFVESLI